MKAKKDSKNFNKGQFVGDYKRKSVWEKRWHLSKNKGNVECEK